MKLEKVNRNNNHEEQNFLGNFKGFFQIAVFSVLTGFYSQNVNAGDIEYRTYGIEKTEENDLYRNTSILLLFSLIISAFYNFKQYNNSSEKKGPINSLINKLNNFFDGNLDVDFNEFKNLNDDNLKSLIGKVEELKLILKKGGINKDLLVTIGYLYKSNLSLTDELGEDKKREDILNHVLSLSSTEKNNGLNNLESLQGSSINAVTALHAAIDILNNQIEKLIQNGQSLDSILLQIKSLTDLIFNFSTMVEEANQKINGLSEFSNRIKQIAKEIKFLSINASIEASKIGEKGNGFKAVGSRVKELSDTTSELASNIDAGLTGFRDWFNKYFLEQFLEIKEKTSKVSEGIMFIRDSFDVTTNSMNDTNRQLDYVESLFFISLVKLDHLVFKQIAYKFVTDKGDLTQNEIDTIRKTHKQCRLGLWYEKTSKDCDSGGLSHNGKGYEKHNKSAEYRKLEYPHSMFHKVVSEIISLVEKSSGNFSSEDYKKLEVLFLKAEKHSSEIFSILDKILSEGTSDVELF